jgi:hypothetical protein
LFDRKMLEEIVGPGTRARRNAYLALGGVLVVAALVVFGRLAPPAHIAIDKATESSVAGADEAAATAADEPADDTALAAADSAQDAGAAVREPISAASFAFDPITDGVPRMRKPDVVRGLYLNAWAAGSTAKLARLIEVANATEINAFVIDVKEGGEVSYRSQVPLARQIGADRHYIRDVRGMLQKLRANGIYPIARIVVFRDAVLADAYPELAVHHVDGGDWQDRDGHRWVDSFNRQVWDYNIAIAREALELGFAEVQWDYVRFPDVPQALMRTAAWPAQQGRTKADGIREFLLYSRAQLAPYDVPVTTDVFGLTVSVRNDMGIGQLWEKMVDATDVLLPMVYPSHFARGSYGIDHPNARPFETIVTAMRHAVRRTEGVPNAATIRPWLQDFTLGAPRYGPAHVRAQIDAVYEAGLDEWVLWHPGSNYTIEALASADGVAPRFPSLDTVAPDSAGRRPADHSGPIGTPVRADSLRPDSIPR